ncbi:15895_t:CDS:2 [Funneliformis mosseae]|uniref:Hsp90 chaperone protein kinase-targeting subunit n=1 Tax=Funneliformis mosseae TaxID=27381 RepID=A0A9N8VAV7_FUNMO|nr:15895_t:CDS:2 [Funneliformis mosseae]
MPIDYSKWDKLELSDDDDFECHPNVDKASFIRWKQADIHQKREDRRRKIEALKLETSNNEVLLGRINDMIKQLQEGGVETFLQTIENLREKNKKIAIEAKNKEALENDQPKEGEGEKLAYPTFDQMMSVLFEKIQEEVKYESPEIVGEGLIDKLTQHREKLSKRQKEAKQELDKEERDAKKKITMDDMHTGFDKSSVSKVAKLEPPKPKPKHTEKKKEKIVEVLNPEAQMKSLDTEKSFKFITKHPEVVSQEIVDQILAEAFQSQLKGKAKYAKQSVHQAWLLQYCQKLGKDGVTLFFRRITAPNPQARDVFMKDVNDTYDRIRERCQIMATEKTQKPQPAKQVEQIQIEVTDPNMSLNVRIPDENAPDEEGKSRYQLFETLPVDFQRALKTGEITKINKVLGDMSVEKAEQVLQICGEADILSIEPGIIDTTQGEVVPGQELDGDKTLVNDRMLNDQKEVS